MKLLVPGSLLESCYNFGQSLMIGSSSGPTGHLTANELKVRRALCVWSPDRTRNNAKRQVRGRAGWWGKD